MNSTCSLPVFGIKTHLFRLFCRLRPFFVCCICGAGLILGASQHGLNAQNIKREDLPKRVYSKFLNIFPDSYASAVWKKEGNLYTAKFEALGEKNTISFDSDAKVKYLWAAYDPNKLPDGILCHLNDRAHYRCRVVRAIRTIDAKGDLLELTIKSMTGAQKTLLLDAQSGNPIQGR